MKFLKKIILPLILLSLLIPDMAFSARLESIEIPARITVILQDGHHKINAKEGILTLMNLEGLNPDTVVNEFKFKTVDKSDTVMTRKIPVFAKQQVLFELLSKGVSGNLEHHANQIGKVASLNMTLELANIEGGENFVARVDLTPSSITSNHLQYVVTEGDLHVKFQRLTSKIPEEAIVPFDDNSLVFQMNQVSNFYNFRSPSEFQYYVPYASGMSHSSVLPIGQDHNGNLVFVDVMSVSKAISVGGKVDIYVDIHKLVRVEDANNFRNRTRDHRDEHLNELLFKKIATFDIADLGWDALNNPESRPKYLMQAMQMIRLLSFKSKLITGVSAIEKLGLQCMLSFGL